MSNIEKIRQEIESSIKAFKFNGSIYNSYEAGELSAYQEILAFIDSLPEEKPSEDLEEAAKEYAKQTSISAVEAFRAFKAGAEWQKEQMMNEAVEGVVCYGSKGAYIESEGLGTTDVEVYGDSGDKVKIVIVKDDNQESINTV